MLASRVGRVGAAVLLRGSSVCFLVGLALASSRRVLLPLYWLRAWTATSPSALTESVLNDYAPVKHVRGLLSYYNYH